MFIFSSPHTVQFHIGHLFHLEGQFLTAKETFEEILTAKSVSSDIKAMALRQLGEWLCVCVLVLHDIEILHINFIVDSIVTIYRYIGFPEYGDTTLPRRQTASPG